MGEASTHSRIPTSHPRPFIWQCVANMPVWCPNLSTRATARAVGGSRSTMGATDLRTTRRNYCSVTTRARCARIGCVSSTATHNTTRKTGGLIITISMAGGGTGITGIAGTGAQWLHTGPNVAGQSVYNPAFL